jgi:DNA-binding IclR family transcriptional regulator
MKSQMMEMQWTKNETILINKNFWGIISCIDDRLKVLDYLMNHRAGQYALGTIKAISQDTGLSTGRVQKFLKALEEKKVIERKGNGVYILSKAMLPISEAV